MKLRKDQQNAVDSIFTYYRSGNKGHPLIVAPTGAGKSHIIAGFCQEVLSKYADQKILIITHTKEIIAQDAKVLRQYISNDLVGVYSVGLGRKQVKQVTVAGIQSIYQKAYLFQDFNLILVDEAHLIPPKGEGRYLTFLGAFEKIGIIGFTATPFRRKHGMLTENHMFDRIVYNISIQSLINQGYLVPLSTKATKYKMDRTGLKVIAEDYSIKDLSNRFDRDSITKAIIDEVEPLKDTKKAWLVFAIDIEHCENIAAELNKRGIIAAYVHSKLDIDRKILIDMFNEGHIQALVAVETLTTGFDAPGIDLIVLLRATKSPVLYVQMLGRGMRTAPNKESCLVLDFAGNVEFFGPVDDIAIRVAKSKGFGLPKAPMKTCPECDELVHISKKVCPSCGYEWPKEVKLNLEATQAAILKSQKEVKSQDINVTEVYFHKHKKTGGIPSLRVTYRHGFFQTFSEWVTFEHAGKPRRMAEKWWKIMTVNSSPVPGTVDEALQRLNEIHRPVRIRVDLTGRFPRIIAHFWSTV